MRLEKLALVLVGICLVTGLARSSATGQVNSERRMTALRSRVNQLKTYFDGIPARQRQFLSGGALNMMKLAENWDRLEASLKKSALHKPTPGPLTGPGPLITDGRRVVPVSDPATDFSFSVMGGFTQSETSTAWCGPNAVVGFNDTGSILESLLFGPGGVSISGVAYSSDQGASFNDAGFVNPGSNPANLLLGDPVVTCASPNTFYYSQIFETANSSQAFPLAAVAVSKSSTAGATWSDPVAVVAKDAFTHFLDKDWLALDPTDNRRIYVTYTDFDTSGDICGFSGFRETNTRWAIELVRSDDAGVTWGQPVVVSEVCDVSPDFPIVEGSQVVVGAGGEVYVAWEAYSDRFSTTREMDFRKSTTHGDSFGAITKVTDVIQVGDGLALQTGFRSNEFPMLTIDRSGTATKGDLYLVWNDGRNLQVPDPESPTGAHGYADILITRSTDGGTTWSDPVRVNNNTEPLPRSLGSDQFMPGVAVDNRGAVAACWYDRRLDVVNFFIERSCGVSTDGGATFSNSVTSTLWEPWHATDVFVDPTYMGDYDTVASDATGSTAGFLGAFQVIKKRGAAANRLLVPNPDVFAVRLQ